MDLDEQIRLHKEISKKIEELEEQKKALGHEILQAMPDKSYQTGPYRVRCCSRLSIGASLEEARQLNATKMEEILDRDKIKALYQSGVPISGVKEIYYIQITMRDDSGILT